MTKPKNLGPADAMVAGRAGLVQQGDDALGVVGVLWQRLVEALQVGDRVWRRRDTPLRQIVQVADRPSGRVVQKVFHRCAPGVVRWV